VTISVISIKGADTKLEQLGTLADITRGQVDLVDPLNLNFSTMLQDSVIATNCIVTVVLHQYLSFRNEPDVVKTPCGVSSLTRDVGNITSASNVTFEFNALVPQSQQIEVVPFQVLITYTKLNGFVCRKVMTVSQPTTRDPAVAEQDIDIRVVSANLAQQSARMAQTGSYEAALSNATMVKEMVQRTKQTEKNKELFAIFMTEYDEISKDLASAISSEESLGLDTSAAARKNARSDQTAKKLYNYKNSKNAACSIQ